MVPSATRRPERTMATRSHRCSTMSSWWEEKRVGTPASARSRRTSLMTSTATGSSPEKGSSRMSSSGEPTRAAASWTRCWLPRLSVWTSSPRRSSMPRRSVHSSLARRADDASTPWSRAR